MKKECSKWSSLRGRKLSSQTIHKILEARKLYKDWGKWNIGRKHSDKAKRRMSELKKGERHPRWKGGITPINKAIRNSLEYKLWREAVFKRDNYTCVWCGAKSEKGKTIFLHADHIKQFAFFPALRFAIDNGRTLCEPCHRKTDTYGKVAPPSSDTGENTK